MCKIYHQAEELHEQGIHVMSEDEKTGIHALERIQPTQPTQPAKPGQLERVEFDYQRHGTPALLANFEVATGNVIFPSIQDTRTEADFLAHIQQLVESDPEGQWIFIADPLNTHKSASRLAWITEQCGVKEDLGEQGKAGILQDESHRTRYYLYAQALFVAQSGRDWVRYFVTAFAQTRGQFKSTDELKERILKFIAFFNETLAKPFRWPYIGKPLLV